MFNLGIIELVIVVFVVLLIFGPKNLPRLGRAIGDMIKGIKNRDEDKDKKE